MTVIVFAIGGNPRGQGRPRSAVKRPKGGGAAWAQIYKDPVSRDYEDSVRKVAVEVMDGRPPLAGAIGLELRFRLEVPKSATKRLRAQYLAGEEPYYGAFDCSNMLKAIEDAFNKVVWTDDKHVVRLTVSKIAHERPGVDIRVEEFS